MTIVDKVTQEIIDWALSNDDFKSYYSYPGEDAKHLDQVMELFISYGDGIEIPSGTVKHVDEFGGEDMGSQRWIIFRVGEDYFQVFGYYNSWDGDNWEGAELEEVEPFERTVTSYRKKK